MTLQVRRWFVPERALNTDTYAPFAPPEPLQSEVALLHQIGVVVRVLGRVNKIPYKKSGSTLYRTVTGKVRPREVTCHADIRFFFKHDG